MEPLLELNEVSYAYKNTSVPVLKEINLKFHAGKVYGIVGKSGSGKSTLLSILAGLDTVSEGEVYYQNKNLNQIDRDRYRACDVGVVFQSFNLLTQVSVIDNIVLSMNISQSDVKDKKEKAYELLETLGINRELAQRKVLKLSGGEQQRVGIARALSHNPNVIIADEPSANLDEETATEIMNIFKKLAHEDGKCVIIVSHARMIASYADELYGINGGRVSFIK